jgi:predicted DsbA family dithiol-disulfide isomerase
MRIEVVSDVICPWCYIGKRHLDKALALVGDGQAPENAWLPFRLDPGMPQGGMPRADYRRAKFGSLERGRQLDARVAPLEEDMKRLGIQGVPTFVLDRKFGVSGAQPPEALAAAIREAATST